MTEYYLLFRPKAFDCVLKDQRELINLLNMETRSAKLYKTLSSPIPSIADAGKIILPLSEDEVIRIKMALSDWESFLQNTKPIDKVIKHTSWTCRRITITPDMFDDCLLFDEVEFLI